MEKAFFPLNTLLCPAASDEGAAPALPRLGALTGWGWEEEEEAEAAAGAAAEAGQDFQTAGFASGAHQLHGGTETNHSQLLGSLIPSTNQLGEKNSTN